MKPIPNYSTWARTDLLDETLKIATRRAEVLKNAIAFDDRLKAKLAAIDAQYHSAYAALLELTRPFDAGAAARLEATKTWHYDERARYIKIALGTERLMQYGPGSQAVAP
ncbi:hypothetical protein [Salinicola aestuarinus]|uniref:hypothetical protein n=1 Tax=Salinicola aestuarinus TaxID=1949082 RepID=UPI000DA13AD2|nr:hypothetical protein [Salinicola aestuarinus]